MQSLKSTLDLRTFLKQIIFCVTHYDYANVHLSVIRRAWSLAHDYTACPFLSTRFGCLNVGVRFSAGMKTAYSVPTKTKRLSYRGLEKGVTLDEGKNLDPSDETHTQVQMQAHIVAEIIWYHHCVGSGFGYHTVNITGQVIAFVGHQRSWFRCQKNAIQVQSYT